MDKFIMIAIMASPFIALATSSFVSAHLWLLVFFAELSVAFKMITDPRIGPKGHSYLPILLVSIIEVFKLRFSDWSSIDSMVTLFALIFAFVESVEFYKKYESEKHKNEVLEKRIKELEQRIQNK